MIRVTASSSHNRLANLRALCQRCHMLRGGGAERDRTADLLNAIQALSQLSYGPVPWEACL